MDNLARVLYLLGVAVLLIVMLGRKNVILPAVIATVITAWAYTGSFFKGLAAPFNGLIVATTELLNLFLVLAVISAMTGAMRVMKTDALMVQPLVRFMRNGHMAFVVLFLASYVMSLVFWPTPTLAILAAALIPAAIAAGLTRLGAAIAIAVSGQGMALGSDYIMGVAPSITASGSGMEASVIGERALILSWIVGAVAVVVAFFLTSRGQLVVPHTDKRIRTNEEIADVLSSAMVSRDADSLAIEGQEGLTGAADHAADEYEARPTSPRQKKWVARGVPLAFLAMVVLLFLARFTDLFPTLNDLSGAALVGGIGFLVLFVVTALSSDDPLEAAAEHVVDGLIFAFKAMGVVLPVAGFVLMGVGDFSGTIMSLGEEASAPSFLFEAIQSGQSHIPAFAPVTCLAIMLAGMMIGLDGSGWAGLPLIGTLSTALGPEVGVAPETLAAIGQNAASWTGGGTLVAWSSLVAVAGVTGISVIELTRRLFIPVVSGLCIAALVAPLIF